MQQFGAPRWEQDQACKGCSVSFATLSLRKQLGKARRHHCRRCGASVCDACCDTPVKLPNLGLTKPVRICKPCGKALGDEKDDLRASVALTMCFVDVLPDKLSTMWSNVELSDAQEMQSAAATYSAIRMYKTQGIGGFGLQLSDGEYLPSCYHV